MGVDFFRSTYIVRRFYTDDIINGYGVASYEDFTAKLNVQPLSQDDLQALPEGVSVSKSFKGYGDAALRTANAIQKCRGDWLYYEGSLDGCGHWYECVSSQCWNHTMLAHYESVFTQVSDIEANRVPKPTELTRLVRR